MQYLLALLALGVATTLQTSEASPSLDAFIKSEMQTSNLPGVSYAVVDNDNSYADAHGVTDLRSGKAVSANTPFLIGSISKSFTATAILQLVEAGDVELDAEVSRYLDVFSGRSSGAITIRQLLGHTSGYSTLQGNDTHVDRTENADELTRQVERIAQWSPAYAPGAKWDYSNANYILLGGIIEAVSGLSFDHYIETQILEPIGMTNSFVGDGRRYEAMATGHTPWFGSKRPVKDFKTSRLIAPAGGVIASANDLALYLDVLLNGRDDIISAESKNLMMQPAGGQSPFYGLGWALNPADGAVYHTGTSPGTETIAIMVPAERKGVVVLVNAGSGMGFGETANLINGISAHALGAEFVRDESSWSRKALFLTFALLPLMFMVGAAQAWLRRAGLRTKSGAFGMFSLWFPLFMTSALAWTTVHLIPKLFGVSISTLHVFSPDLAIALMATAVTGLIWAVFRLGVFFSAKRSTQNGQGS